MGRRRTFEEFYELANKIHNNKYEYDEKSFNEKGEKIKIFCKKHGWFVQTKSNHLKGKGCSKCYGNCKLTNETFIERAKLIHGDKYDYSKVNYIDYETSVCIICPIHGEFLQTPENHLHNKQECPQCAHRSYIKTLEEFITDAKVIHRR